MSVYKVLKLLRYQEKYWYPDETVTFDDSVNVQKLLSKRVIELFTEASEVVENIKVIETNESKE